MEACGELRSEHFTDGAFALVTDINRYKQLTEEGQDRWLSFEAKERALR